MQTPSLFPLAGWINQTIRTVFGRTCEPLITQRPPCLPEGQSGHRGGTMPSVSSLAMLNLFLSIYLCGRRSCVWVPGIKLRSSGLAAGSLPCWAISLTCMFKLTSPLFGVQCASFALICFWDIFWRALCSCDLWLYNPTVSTSCINAGVTEVCPSMRFMINIKFLWKWHSLGCLESDYEINTLGPLHTWLVSLTGCPQKVQRTSGRDSFHIWISSERRLWYNTFSCPSFPQGRAGY